MGIAITISITSNQGVISESRITGYFIRLDGFYEAQAIFQKRCCGRGFGGNHRSFGGGVGENTIGNRGAVLSSGGAEG